MSPLPLINIPEVKKVIRDKHLLTAGYQTNFKERTNEFLGFNSLSGGRSCECKNGYPKPVTRVERDGSSVDTIVCSECGGPFYNKVARDFSFTGLIMGMKGSGKSTFVMSLANVEHTFDPYRRIALWQCPRGLITKLNNLRWCKKYGTICERALGIANWDKDTPPLPSLGEPDWKKKGEKHRICDNKEANVPDDCLKCTHFKDGFRHFVRVENQDELQFGDIVIMDEGIISVNATEALRKEMRDWRKFLAVVRHKRIILWCLFQRYDIIKSIRELSDLIIYKRLPMMLIDNEQKDKFLRENKETITKLKKWEAILLSDHHLFDGIMKLENRVPEWYTAEISMSYESESEFLGDKGKRKHELELINQMGKYIFENYSIGNKADERAIKDALRQNFFGYNLTSTMIAQAIDHYYYITQFETLKNDELNLDPSNPSDVEAGLQSFGGKISKLEYQVFVAFCKETSLTQFNKEPYNLTKQEASRIVRKVGLFLAQEREKEPKEKNAGDEAEKFVQKNIWENNGYAIQSIGSGGIRGNGLSSPDLLVITPEGKLRLVQVKMRNDGTEHFHPATFDSELHGAMVIGEIIKKNQPHCPKCEGKISTCSHCGTKLENLVEFDGAYLYGVRRNEVGEKTPTFIMEKLSLPDNKLTLSVNYTTGKVTRKPPDLDKIQSPRIREFCLSDAPIEAIFNMENKKNNETNKKLDSTDGDEEAADEESS